MGVVLRLFLVASALLAAVPAGALNHQSLACLECHARLGRPTGTWNERDWRDIGICLGCHDGTATMPDVLRDAPEALARGFVSRGDGRSAGGLNLVGDRGGPSSGGYHEFSGHTIGSPLPPPGFGGTWPPGARLVCKSCHAIHPNGNFRNLGPDPYLRDPEYLAFFGRLFAEGAQPRAAVVGAEADLGIVATDVLVFAGPRVGEGDYDASRVMPIVHPPRDAMNAFCATCHSGFHGDANTRARIAGTPTYVRHPTSGVPIAGRMRERLAEARQPLRVSYATDGTAEVGCLTCHRAHGTRNPFGLVHWDGSSESNDEDGAGAGVESLCLNCHRFDE